MPTADHPNLAPSAAFNRHRPGNTSDDDGTNNDNLTDFTTGVLKNDSDNYKSIWNGFGPLCEGRMISSDMPRAKCRDNEMRE